MVEYYEKIYRELYNISQEYFSLKCSYENFRKDIYLSMYLYHNYSDAIAIYEDYLIGDKNNI